MKKGILRSIVSIGVIFAILLTVSAAFAQDDMQEAKASFMGAGVKFKMDKPSMKARNLESANTAQVKEAREFRNMDKGLLSGMFNGGDGDGVRSRPIKDTKIICEVCKAKAVVNASENCEFCKGKAYADLCDKCIAWSILNACDECKAKIRGKVGKKEEAVNDEKAAEENAAEESVKAPAAEPADEIIADETASEKEIEKPKSKTKKKVSKKSKAKAAKKIEKAEEVIE
ncbi:MAG: hypothetical protein A2008_03105 [Candidatus Wallbacteria bacterium GWC2_49_35]|uniref:Uncharacterized protein n=1 Tax=Candidatus Wallbacteria bacterium GWC2_49_35 TaxID=1817813 RepID=A0A1F7WJX8_9BACT|nr:MAG: hypothetical protein A2008_03105 [Candidatus Wallbacteria bacterium GWC2_49_35]HBC76219.1 hypothetical protein [Candidatus Wallbacteria bacterium]